MSINYKYIDSHWLIFALKGLIAFLVGWLFLFTPSSTDMVTLMSFIAIFLIALGIIELSNAIHRRKYKKGWIVSLIIAFIDALVAISLLFVLKENPVWQLSLLAAYTAIRGICEIIVGIRRPDDMTDRFIWVLCGICGATIGIVILNSGHLETGYFIRLFGSYVLIFGACNLIYGIHNCDQKITSKKERSKIATKKK